NFVTIAQRADAPAVQNLWAGAPGENGARPKAAPPAPAAHAEEGVIETFTIVYVTPDGFLPPLALALIRTPDGRLLMAQGEDETPLRIGQEALMKLFRRKPALKSAAKEPVK